MGLFEDVADHLDGYFGGAARRMDPHNLFGPGRLEGDDAHDYLDAFSARFGIDLTGFQDYLHFDADEPPIHRRVWGVTPDGIRMDYIRIGLSDLVRAAEAGRWDMTYPAVSVRFGLPS